jgi:ADP-ribose pyrophosphatase YjhB (NUDIX family)
LPVEPTGSGAAEERLNVYDAHGHVVGAARRSEAKGSGQAVGAVNVLLVNARGDVLLQRRPEDKENGGLWDKSVGGHVSAGEEFDETAVREAGEELFDDGASPRVRLATSEEAFAALLTGVDLAHVVLFRRSSLQLGLRDVRHAPGRAEVRNVLYHVAVYLGRTDVPREGFRPQADEIADLAYFDARTVDAMLLRGELAPNMAFLWLTHAGPLLTPLPPTMER